MKQTLFPIAVLAATACSLAFTHAAVLSAAQLSQRLAAGDVIRLVDLRPQGHFAKGSIPGAMNIPASIILEKPLPALGHVVLFDDGLGAIDVKGIAAILNRRAGWQVDELDGGLGAWQSLNNAPFTSQTGLADTAVQQITYERLLELQEPVVLVDLRTANPGEDAAALTRQNRGKPSAAAAADPLRDFCAKGGTKRKYIGSTADLRRQFGAVRKNRSKQSATTATATGTPPLVVLVNHINGDCRESARRLRNEGFTRILILAGGDEAIRLEGRRGVGRTAGVIGGGDLPTSPSPQPPAAKP